MDEDAQLRFETELCWCIQKLESALGSGKLKNKQYEETSKTLKILQSTKAPLIKKRQVMSNQFGNYRSKMEEEAKKIEKGTRDVKFKKAAPSKKSLFLQKCAKKQGDGTKPTEMPQNIEGSNPVRNTVFKFQPSDNAFKFNFVEE